MFKDTTMSRYLLIYIISIFSTDLFGVKADLHGQFVTQTDMSEYCRRQVIPAVFLGRRVVDANSQILHFSRLEVPYSCLIIVRTEMGSNIVVVIEIVPDIDLKESCENGDYQFRIHEMAETFGGYWGQIPDGVMQTGSRRDDGTYTLKHEVTIRPWTVTKSTTTTSSTTTRSTTTEINEGYMSVELPILNVSAVIVPGIMDQNYTHTTNTEDIFDSIIDLPPRGEYDTKEIPLLEVEVKNRKGGPRVSDTVNEGDPFSQFVMEVNDMFTPDPRLLFNNIPEATSRKKFHKYRVGANTRLDFKKNNLFIAKESLHTKKLNLNQRPQLNTVQPNNYLSKLHDVKDQKDQSTHEGGSKSEPHYWDAIHDILENLTQTSEVTQPAHEELANFLRRVSSNKKFSQRAYWMPGLSHLDMNTPRVPIIKDVFTTTQKQLAINRPRFYELNELTNYTNVPQEHNESFNRLDTEINNESAIINDDIATMMLPPLPFDVNNIILNVTNQHRAAIQDKQWSDDFELNTTTNTEKVKRLPIALVDHESFDNVVKSASAMAKMLNLHETSNKSATPLDETKKTQRSRKKRHLHAIDIEEAKPRQIQNVTYMTTTEEPDQFDLREIQEFVELQDDEIYDRVSLQYLRQFIGPPLKDFCDLGNDNRSSTRHVFLFNSSRLVLALSNFTMKRMTIILTPARSLLESDSRCGPALLECQISATRVCIDSLCACDGVPNCGSNEIYDEDRLNCGTPAGWHRNVSLAGITFLAVLLTALYTAHYWLKRCVPRVSEAFFIYTDEVENLLYLDTIMRSPHDKMVSKDFFCPVQESIEYAIKPDNQYSWKRFVGRLLKIFRRKKIEKAEVATDFDQMYSDRLYALDGIELNKMTNTLTDTAVQTGASLQEDISSVLLVKTSLESKQSFDELSMLQFFKQKKVRSISQQQDAHDLGKVFASQKNTVKTSIDEELRSDVGCVVDFSKTEETVTIERHPFSEKPSVSDTMDKSAVKHLRFEDQSAKAKAKDDSDDAVETITPDVTTVRRSVVLGAGKSREDVSHAPEDQPGTSRELKSYFNWRSGKEKKTKKKSKKK